MAEKKPVTKPPAIHNHYGADRHLLNILLYALITVVLYFAFTSLMNSPIMMPEQKDQTTKVKVISGGVEREITVPRESPPPRVQ